MAGHSASFTHKPSASIRPWRRAWCGAPLNPPYRGPTSSLSSEAEDAGDDALLPAVPLSTAVHGAEAYAIALVPVGTTCAEPWRAKLVSKAWL